MNCDEVVEQIGFISEKLLPEKIKNIIWNKKTDIIVINCGNYFEVHRIGFKHEEIFKREEKCKIKDIVFINNLENETSLAVILEDTTLYYVNLSTAEITLQNKLKNGFRFEEIYADSFVNKGFSKIDGEDINPFNSELSFNSFSKIDVSLLNFLHINSNFSLCYIFNFNEISFYLNFLINFANFNLPKNFNFVSNLVYKDNPKILLGEEEYCQKDKLNLNFQIINFDKLSTKIEKTFFRLYFSTLLLDYIANILSLFTKIINKLGIIFFDKYIFANNLEHELNDTNEEIYKNLLNDELKKLMYLGNCSEYLKNLKKKDLFEGKSILKMDENIFFNLKNIEDIFVENIKPILNTLSFYINEIKYYIEMPEEITKLENIFNCIYIKFDTFLASISTLKNNYRNFLAWIYKFNNVSTEVKNNLSSIVVDYESLKNFIHSSSYNMKHIIDLFEQDKTESQLKPLQFESELLKNKLIMSNLKNITNISLNEDHPNSFKGNSIKTNISLLKEKINKMKTHLSTKMSNELILENLFTLSNIPESITLEEKKFYKVFSNTNSNFLLFRINVKFSDNLFLFKFENQFEFLKLNLRHEGISIIDFELHQNKELILLVKSSAEVDQNTSKFCLIVSSLSNYNLNRVENKAKFDYDYDLDVLPIDTIRIDKIVHVDCSINSFISVGERGLVSVIDNTKNKIWIYDIINNNSN